MGDSPDLYSIWLDMVQKNRALGLPKKAPGLEGVPTTFPKPPASPADIRSSSVPPTNLMKYVQPGSMGPTSLPTPPMATVPPSPAVTGSPAPAKPASWSENLEKGLQDPGKMGLLAAGLSLMSTPPRKFKYSAGELIGTAGLQGLQYFRQAVKDKQTAELAKSAQEERTLAREERTQHYKAQERDWQERRELMRESQEDKAAYYQEQADTRRMNAETLAEMRAVNSATKQALDKPVPENVREFFGLEKGTTIRDFKEMGGDLDLMKKPEKKNLHAVGPDDAGAYRILDMDDGGKVVSIIEGAGKTAKGAKEARPTTFSEELARARKSLDEQFPGRQHTEAQIAAERLKLYPKGSSSSGAGASIRESLMGGGAPKGTAKRVRMPDGTILYFDKDGKRVQ